MSQPDNINVDDKIASNHANLAALDISATDSINDETLDTFYNRERLLTVMMATLDYIDNRINNGLDLTLFCRY